MTDHGVVVSRDQPSLRFVKPRFVPGSDDQEEPDEGR